MAKSFCFRLHCSAVVASVCYSDAGWKEMSCEAAQQPSSFFIYLAIGRFGVLRLNVPPSIRPFLAAVTSSSTRLTPNKLVVCLFFLERGQKQAARTVLATAAKTATRAASICKTRG